MHVLDALLDRHGRSLRLTDVAAVLGWQLDEVERLVEHEPALAVDPAGRIRSSALRRFLLERRQPGRGGLAVAALP